MAIMEFLRAAALDFFEYDTPRSIVIKSRLVGVINRLIQLIIIFYIIGYVIIYKKGYQEFDDVKGAVTTKVKGIAFITSEKLGNSTLDVADYVIPPQETNAFFVMTSFIRTVLQEYGNCPEHPDVKEAHCVNDSQCARLVGTVNLKGNGPFTGKCVNVSIEQSKTNKTCEIYGWCLVEDDRSEMKTTFDDSVNFTVLIKNNIEFPKFDVRRRNIRNWYANDSELGNCRWNGSDPKDKYCPIFILGDMTKSIGISYTDMLKVGGIIKIIITWDCDLDHDVDECLPEYSFKRLDRGNYSLSVGFNFRYADHYSVSEGGRAIILRNLYKVFGVHFLIEVRGQAGQFRIVPLMVNIGSGMALLGIASVLCDIMVLNILKAKDFYKRKKYLIITEDPCVVVNEDFEDQADRCDLKRESNSTSAGKEEHENVSPQV